MLGTVPNDDIVAVTLGKEKVGISVALPFYCHTDGYRPILHRNNSDLERIRYINGRYNQAVEIAIKKFPRAEHIFIIDSYYLDFSESIKRLVSHYSQLKGGLLGGAILCWDRSRLRPRIVYYDTLSIPEMTNKRWPNENSLPDGLAEVSGIGASWIFPKSVWEKSGGFHIDTALANTRCLNVRGYKLLLDWDARFWRTSRSNPEIQDGHYPLSSRLYKSVAMSMRIRTRIGLKRRTS
jgi:hypothetical protein